MTEGTQLHLFDFLYPEILNPLREVAKRASPYWVTSRSDLIALRKKNPNMIDWTMAVKKEYSPYGGAGHYGSRNGPNTLDGWNMTYHGVEVTWIDENGRNCQRTYAWSNFANEIQHLIDAGEYEENEA